MSRLAGMMLAVMLSYAPAHALDGNEIVQKADLARRPGESFIWNVKITSYEGNKKPVVNEYEVYVKGPDRSFVKFLRPPREIGRSLLALGRDLWIYLPDAGKPVRIPFAQRLVGQVANGDIARVDYAGDYNAKLLGNDTVEGVPAYVLDLQGKTKDVTYAAIKYWVSIDGFRPIKAEYLAGTGTLLKSGSFGDYKGFNGRLICRRLTLVDAIQHHRRSVLEFGNLRVRDLPDRYFDKNYMKTLD